MTISKLLTLFCALALGAASVTLARADDNPAQAAARLALAKQLFAISAQQPTNAPDAKVRATADKAAADAKAKQNAAQAAADWKAKQDAQASAVAQAQAQAKADTKDAAAAVKSDADQKADAERAALAAALNERTNAEMQAKNASSNSLAAAASVDSKKEKKKKKAAAAPALQPVAVVQTNTADINYLGKDLGMKQIAAPTLPISSAKADRLQALLAKYKADQLTPDEYHQQRAAILAEP